MIDEVVVYFVSLCRFARSKPVNATRVSDSLVSFLKEQNIRDCFGVRRLLECCVGKSNRTEQFRAFCHILSRCGIEFVQRSFTGNNSNNAVRSDPINAFGNKVIVNHELLPRILAVIYAVPAEWYIGHNYIKIVWRKTRLFKSLDLNLRLRIQLRRDLARYFIQFNTVQTCSCG